MNHQLAAMWTHLLLAGVVFSIVAYSRRRAWKRRVVLLLAVLAAASLLGAVFTWPGLLSAQKVATRLVLPMGLMWSVLLLAMLWAWGARRRAILACLAPCWFFLSLAGNEVLSSSLLMMLEREFVGIDPFEQEPFDAVLVLGGGVAARESGYAQLNSSGDRAMLAARMYHQGQTPLLVCAGGENTKASDRLDSAGATRTIWRQLNVPDGAVLQIAGRNTSEEIAAFTHLAAEHDWRNVGIITSAWHMKRAMRLARRRNLALQPLPADFRGDAPRLLSRSVIPSPQAFANTETALREILAMAVGR